MTFVSENGASAFGARLRQLSERIDRDVARLYKEAGVVFEPRWYGVVALLRKKEPLTVIEIAARLGLTHPAVSQVAQRLKAEGLIASTSDKNDQRRQLLTLTPEAHRRCATLDPLWNAIIRATEELVAKEVPGLLPKLNALDDALIDRPINERVRNYLGDQTRES